MGLENLLAGLLVVPPARQGPRELSALLSSIRRRRNRLARVAGVLISRLGEARSEVLRQEHVYEQSKAELITGEGLNGRNEAERRAFCAVTLERQRSALLKAKLALRRVESMVDLVKWYREELDRSFEEASRQLTALELEWKFETGGK